MWCRPLKYRAGFPRDRLHRGLILLKNLALSQCDLKGGHRTELDYGVSGGLCAECIELLHSCPENENVMLPSSEPFCLGCCKCVTDCEHCIKTWETSQQAFKKTIQDLESALRSGKDPKEKQLVIAIKRTAAQKKRDLDASVEAHMDQEICKLKSEITQLKLDIEQVKIQLKVHGQEHPCPINEDQPRRRESILFAIVRDRDNAYADPIFASLPQDRLRSLMCLVASRQDTGGAAQDSGDESDTPLNPPRALPCDIPSALPTTVAYVCTTIVEMRNTWGRTALHEAVLKPSAYKLQILLTDLKANPLAIDDQGKNVMHIAAQFGTPEGMEMLYESVKDQPERARKLLTNAEPRHNRIPLHMAASYNRPLAIDMIMKLHDKLHSQHGIQVVQSPVDQRCQQFRTPLHWACIHACGQEVVAVEQCIELLVSYGANVNAQDFELHTPIHSAIKNKCQSQTLKFLLDQTSDNFSKMDSAIYIDGQPFYGPVVFCNSKESAADGTCACTREVTKNQTLSAKSRCPAALCGLPHSFTVPHDLWPSTTSDEDYTCVIEEQIKRSTKPRVDFHRKAFPSLLMLASKYGDPDSIHVLLNHGASVWALDSNYDLPIFAAIRALAAAEKAVATKETASEAEAVVAEAKAETAEAAEATFKQLTTPLQETIMLLLNVMAQPESDTSIFTAGLAQGKARENPFIRRLFLKAVDSMKHSHREGSKLTLKAKLTYFENAVKTKYASLRYGEWPSDSIGMRPSDSIGSVHLMFHHFQAFLLLHVDNSSEQQLESAIRSEFLRLTLERHATISDRTVQHGHPFLKETTPLDYCMDFFEGEALSRFCSAMQQLRVRPLDLLHVQTDRKVLTITTQSSPLLGSPAEPEGNCPVTPLFDSLGLLRLPEAMNVTNCEGQTTRLQFPHEQRSKSD